MNAAGMIFQQLMQSKPGVQQTLNKESAPEQQRLFASLLMENGDMAAAQGQLKNANDLKQLMSSQAVQKLMNQAGSKEKAVQLLAEMFGSAAGKGIETEAGLQSEKEAVISQLFANQGSTRTDSGQQEQVDQRDMQPLSDAPTSQSLMTDQNIQVQLSNLYAKIDKLLAQISDKQSMLKKAPALLKSLEQWSELIKKTNKQTGTILESLPENSDKNQKIWKELVQAFQKRNQLVMKQQYNTSAKVTSSDVAKWLGNAIQNQVRLDKAAANQTGTTFSSLPMSKVEQYVVHVNQTQNTQPVDHQLIEQFRQVMKTSHFSTTQNGASQLNISLRPENLGDMTVKLAQMNGEMTVKIVVTSAAAKDMLEANMHQLKSIFSPQQVVIEKQEVTAEQTQPSQYEEEGQLMEDHDQEQSEKRDEQQEDEDSYEQQFQEVLMNEGAGEKY